MIPFNRCEDADGAGQQTPHSCLQHKQKEDCLAVQRAALYTHSPGKLPALLGDGIKTGFKQAAWPQESNLPDTECLFSHSKRLSGALSPETEHVNSSAWGTEDPAWGGTRGGQAWGDTAAALIHPAPRSSEHCCSRGERCWRAHRRTLLSTGSWGTAGGTYTRCRVASKGSVSEKGWWCSQHSTSQPSSHSSIDHKDFLHSSNTRLSLPGSQDQPRVTDH